MSRCATYQVGSLLLEMLIMMLIFSWILADYTDLLRFQKYQQKDVDQLLEIGRRKQSLLGFLQVNAFLPCPDVDGDGVEDRLISSGVSICRNREGMLPFKTLGIPAGDLWQRRYYYRVHQRSESMNYVNEICQPAAVFGSQGESGLENAWFCPSSGFMYCTDSGEQCREVCFGADHQRMDCLSNVDLRQDLNQPPYFHLSTPPIGTVPVAYALKIWDTEGSLLEKSAMAVVMSWGGAGASVNRDSCAEELETNVKENCDGDREFVLNPFVEKPQYLRWIDMDEAKMTLIYSGRLK
ncbi:hypothetical protein [Thiomicrorhabdus sp.]|uniref:hypothetical protein n=1 Tax=Thiomicrorhabdus sp. TaxID=2039724 RepID=UPI0029C8881D|nr:hypothetical protein [Thiomicrorhabdus sp.]